MKIVEINGTNYSSTGNIALNIAKKAREEGYGEKKVEKKACIFPSFLFLIPSDQRCPPCLPSSIQSRSNHQDLGAGGQ